MSEATAPTKSNRPYWRAVLQSPNVLTACLVVIGCTAIAWLNAKLLFVDFSLPKGDQASNDILVTAAKHLALFHGNYSRMSFYHPGPFYFQWMAIFEWLFVDTFHVFVSPQAAQYFSIATLNVIAFALYFRLWLVWTGNVLIAVAALLITNAVPCAVIGENYVVTLWPPFMYLASALMTVTGLMGMAARGISWLPLFIFGLAQLVHGQASFVGLVPIMLLTSAAVTWAAGRLPDRIWQIDNAIAYVNVHRRPFIISAAIALLFALPMAIDTVLSWPGQFPKYFSYAGAGAARQKPVAAVRYVLSFVPFVGIWALVFLLPTGTSKARPPRNDYRFIGLLVLATATVPALFYAWRGIDDLGQRYLLFWVSPFSGAALTTAVLYVASFISVAWLRVGLITAAAVGSMPAYRILAPVYPDTRSTALTAAAADLLARRAVKRDKIALQLDHDPAGWPPAWSEAVAIIAATNRKHEDFLCVEQSSWHLLFHERYRCQASDVISEILYVVAKGKTHGERIAELADADIIATRPPTVGTTLRPGNLDGLGAALLGDWSVAEPWGVWSDGNNASLSFDASLLPPRFVLSMRVRLFPDKPPPVQTVKVTDDEGRELAVLTNTAAQQTVDARIEMAKPASPHMTTLKFEIMHPVAPRDIGLTRDRRRLGIGLEQLGFEN